MASIDIVPGVQRRIGAVASRPRSGSRPQPRSGLRATELHGVEAGLDALDAVRPLRTPVARVLRETVLPPLLGLLLVLVLWQGAYSLQLTSEYRLPGPAMVWHSLTDLWYEGTLFSIIWTSVWRGLSGFAAAVVIGTPIGLLVARVRFVRAAVGPVLSGLQSLPSVAWVPAAVIWLGINSSAMYAVILLGAVPSVANGLIGGIDQIPPLFLRAGRAMGATGLAGARHVLLPAALPGYLAGLRQGWAFSWRSLMAAELIASSPDLGLGLGRYLENQREFNDMSGVLLGIILILFVGVAIDLLVFTPLERWLLRNRDVRAAR
ncbi:ABC transporter permease [Kitasatospora sp. GP82]|uniref:ABC transporter permease n=1 Tax=Kitasatospora sp. GP82 TaxID=3035089 RepID=UPI0024751F97|nr:ABC transporter permease [Kitasatospora sp. GP82]MDH6128964.1 NitT/TauT family transport system permease protein [Kitasatospora sp. GP82]